MYSESVLLKLLFSGLNRVNRTLRLGRAPRSAPMRSDLQSGLKCWFRHGKMITDWKDLEGRSCNQVGSNMRLK